VRILLQSGPESWAEISTTERVTTGSMNAPVYARVIDLSVRNRSLTLREAAELRDALDLAIRASS
jgi:hypothetical protein